MLKLYLCLVLSIGGLGPSGYKLFGQTVSLAIEAEGFQIDQIQITNSEIEEFVTIGSSIQLKTGNSYNLTLLVNGTEFSSLSLSLADDGDIDMLGARPRSMKGQKKGKSRPIAKDFYRYENGLLTLIGRGVEFDWNACDFPSIKYRGEWIEVDKNQKASINCFPGTYKVELGNPTKQNGFAELQFHVQANGRLQKYLEWRECPAEGSSEGPWEKLNSNAYKINSLGNAIALLGKRTTFNVGVDNSNIVLVDYGLILSDRQEISVFPGRLHLRIGSRGKEVAEIFAHWDNKRNRLGAEMNWTDVDGSQIESKSFLDKRFFFQEKQQVNLKGQNILLDFSESFNDLSVWEVQNKESGEYSLFPGDYWIRTSGAQTGFWIEIPAQMETIPPIKLGSKAQKRPGRELLDKRFYTIEQNKVQLHGAPFLFDLSRIENGTVTLAPGKRNGAELRAGLKNEKFLFPGTYWLNYSEKEAREISTRIKFTVPNSSNDKPEPLHLISPGEPYSLGDYQIPLPKSSGSLSYNGIVLEDLPDPNDSFFPAKNPFATLKPTLDGSYYRVENEKLFVKYAERYWTNEDLDIRIVTSTGQVTPLQNINRAYGPNWIELTFPPSDYARGEFYTLEVSDPKGRLYSLRFFYP